MRKIIILAALVLWASGSTCRTSRSWHKTTLFYFDTVCEVNLYCSEMTFRSAQENIQRIFNEIDRLFAPGRTDTSSVLVVDLYRKAKGVFEKSQGSFDITVHNDNVIKFPFLSQLAALCMPF